MIRAKLVKFEPTLDGLTITLKIPQDRATVDIEMELVRMRRMDGVFLSAEGEVEIKEPGEIAWKAELFDRVDELVTKGKRYDERGLTINTPWKAEDAAYLAVRENYSREEDSSDAGSGSEQEG